MLEEVGMGTPVPYLENGPYHENGHYLENGPYLLNSAQNNFSPVNAIFYCVGWVGQREGEIQNLKLLQLTAFSFYPLLEPSGFFP
ncbi:hypothetical protein AVEN_227182-1 [Araneus ventricosus]|uniref:Uncharacterized protein n=1 Tax=Araneus ventricosus TaxID=182803 RepID=A0A4Y2BXD1_ARAVE|nr:hypothetical protein AVEN_227182-1 [Araneus ventricosus]